MASATPTVGHTQEVVRHTQEVVGHTQEVVALRSPPMVGRIPAVAPLGRRSWTRFLLWSRMNLQLQPTTNPVPDPPYSRRPDLVILGVVALASSR